MAEVNLHIHVRLHDT